MPTVAGALGRLKRRLGRIRNRVGSRMVVAGDRRDRRLLIRSALFDDDWYSLALARQLSRRAAVEHYLATGRRRGLTPHPLFDPEFCVRQLGLDSGDEEAADDALVVYLRDRRFDIEVHPLFDVARYIEDNPGAPDHRDGPIGHYCEFGAARGARVNDWYRPDPVTEPRGLVDWIWADARDWVERQAIGLPAWGGPPAPAISDAEEPPLQDELVGVMSVVLVADTPGVDLSGPINSLLAQTDPDWELLVLGVGHNVDAAVVGVPTEPRIRVVPERQPSTWAARNAGLHLARGTHVAWMSPASTWLPGRLRSIRRALVASGSVWAHDCAREDRRGKRPSRHASRRASRARLLAGVAPELMTVVVERKSAAEIGGFDESLRGGHALDFLLRMSALAEPGFAPGLGVVLDVARLPRPVAVEPNDRPWVDFEKLASSADVVLNEHLVAWEELAGIPSNPGVVSVLVPTYQDWEMTALAVRRVVEDRVPGVVVELIVVDNGCGLVTSAVLASLALKHDQVRVVRAVVNHGFSLGNNLGLSEARGDVVVFLNNDTEVQPGWLEPLLESLSDDEVLGVQSLLVYPDGTIQSAGIVFAPGDGPPHVLLQAFPVEDARGLENDPLHALTGAAVAMRRSDLIALRGFDPVFRNGMEDVDICLRLGASRPGRFVVRPDSVVIHHESKTPGRFARSVMNRRVLVDRWAGRFPADDVAAWRRRGYDVVGHQIKSRPDLDQRLCVAEPVVTRVRPLEVVEGVPSLRWAVKHAAPTGPEGEKWGDTHFARHLADALRGLGQEVVIDHNEALMRTSGSLDDVVVLLRGVAHYTPLLDRVNLMWVISHPDMVARFEHIGWDRVYVASVLFADRMAREWGAPAVPLLQATDPTRFHPDLAEPDTGEPLLFIGNSRRQHRPLVVAAAELGLPLSIYGSGWEGIVDDRYIRAHYVPNSEVGAAYRAAGVVLNDHWSDMRDNGFLSNRLFDAVAAGARVVTDDAAGVDEVFGDAVRVVGDPAGLKDLLTSPDLDAVFGDDETRRRRAAKVAAEHSFAARARTMLDDALAIRASRGLR